MIINWVREVREFRVTCMSGHGSKHVLCLFHCRMTLNTTMGQQSHVSELPASLLLHDKIQLDISNIVLGRGGFGSVYLGSMIFPDGEKKIVAAKENNYTSAGGPLTREEIRVYELLKEHPNIVKYFGCTSASEDIKDSLILLEYMPKTLHEVIHRDRSLVTYRALLKVLYGIVDGMCHLHSNYVVHFDLKPSNILLTPDMIPKIADFGISKIHVHNRSMSASCRGTRRFMAPELLGCSSHKEELPKEGKIFKKIINSVDIFSFGMMAYDCVTGGGNLGEAENNMLVAQEKFVEVGGYRPHKVGCDCPYPLRAMIEGCLRFKADAENVRQFDRPTAPELRMMIANMLKSDWLDESLPWAVG